MEKYPRVPPGFESYSTSSDSDSEPEPNQYVIKPSPALTKPGPQSGLKTEPQELPSSASDEKGSEKPRTGPQPDSDGPDPTLSTIAANARDGPMKPNGGFCKPGNSDSATGKKRAADGKTWETKRSKKKRAQFERLFSEEDEIVLLNAMIRFAEKNKSDPFADLDAFRDFVKADLNVNATKDQLKHKMRKFKTKYNKNMRKQASGIARSLKAHEQMAFELSKLAWANEYIKDQKMVRSPKAAGKKKAKAMKAADVAGSGGGAIKLSAGKESDKVKKASDVAEDDGGACNALVAAEIVSLSDVSVDMTNISRIGAQLFGGEGVEGEDEWRELKKAEMEIYLKKVQLMCNKTQLALDVLKAKKC